MLPAPAITYKGQGPQAMVRPKDGAWQTSGKQLLRPPAPDCLKEYALICHGNQNRSPSPSASSCPRTAHRCLVVEG